MKFEYVKKEHVQKDMPHVLHYLEEKDFELSKNGFELEISAGGYGELRLRVLGCVDNEKGIIYDEIEDYLLNHCCQCGGSNYLRRLNREGFECYPLYICEECCFLESDAYKQIIYTIKKQSISPENSKHRKCGKLRLKTENGNIIYRHLDEVLYKDDCFVTLDRKNGVYEKVKIAGFDLSLRDSKGERVYAGDIIVAENERGGKFWGMVVPDSHNRNWFDGPFSNYKVVNHEDGPLGPAKKITIIGSVCDIENFENFEEEYDNFCQWTREK